MSRAQPIPQMLDITATRVVEGPINDVFAAWVCTDHLAHWFGPRDGDQDFTTPHVLNDPRPDGTYRICIRSPQGVDYWMRGQYKVVDPPSRLVFSHGWEDQAGAVEHEGQITVEFSPHEGKTRVQFRKSGFPSESAREGEVGGWNECLDRLVAYFATGAARTGAASDEAEIRRLIAEWSRALEARDIDGLLAHYDPDIALFDLTQRYRTDGAAGYRRNWETRLPCFPATFESKHRDLQIHVSGDLAFCHGLHRFVVPGEPNHPVSQSWIRITIGWRKINGRWRVVHEHASLPFDPQTGRVVPLTDEQVRTSPIST